MSSNPSRKRTEGHRRAMWSHFILESPEAIEGRGQKMNYLDHKFGTRVFFSGLWKYVCVYVCDASMKRQKKKHAAKRAGGVSERTPFLTVRFKIYAKGVQIQGIYNVLLSVGPSTTCQEAGEGVMAHSIRPVVCLEMDDTYTNFNLFSFIWKSSNTVQPNRYSINECFLCVGMQVNVVVHRCTNSGRWSKLICGFVQDATPIKKNKGTLR